MTSSLLKLSLHALCSFSHENKFMRTVDGLGRWQPYRKYEVYKEGGTHIMTQSYIQ